MTPHRTLLATIGRFIVTPGLLISALLGTACGVAAPQDGTSGGSRAGRTLTVEEQLAVARLRIIAAEQDAANRIPRQDFSQAPAADSAADTNAESRAQADRELASALANWNLARTLRRYEDRREEAAKEDARRHHEEKVRTQDFYDTKRIEEQRQRDRELQKFYENQANERAAATRAMNRAADDRAAANRAYERAAAARAAAARKRY